MGVLANNIISIAIIAGLSSFIYYLLIKTRLVFILDIPNSRSSHTRPTLRGGGVLFVCMSACAALYFVLGKGFAYVPMVFIVSTPLAVIGYIDDKRDISRLARLAFQTATAGITLIMSPAGEHINWIFYPVIILVFVGIVNMSNFMDGLDGLAAGCMLIIFSTILIISFRNTNEGVHILCLKVLVAVLLGFLMWNWSPAKIFMGDVGSTYLGSVLAGLLLGIRNINDVIGILLVSSPLFLDSLSCMLRRYMNNENILIPHKKHLYQRLHQNGLSHSTVASLYIASTSILAVSYLSGGLFTLVPSTIVMIAIGLIIDRLKAARW